ncbi:hypothetical protein TanjilG_09250 [Lupinus angustifolius]|uniref:Pollen allergen Ole e 1 family n=1 Tax=Lupinus angustifolius TaxID=3871 RepID=A0A4P1QWT2_LUPAN|nr:PREDICTED: protein DOWNSTREAM OF FLC-like [Lupinus angustifolius]OIV96708.1 hypothetical protein TanjilG_09250 [Lupinus angustifolius]
MASSRVALVLFMCVLPAMIAAIRPEKNPFSVKGRVFCDPCRATFETSATTYIAGAEVILQCTDRATNEVVYTKKGITDSTGTYIITVNEDHKDQVCNAKLVNSNHPTCNEAAPGRDAARVILTGYNGIASNNRFANAMGYMTREVASGCADVLKQYQEFDKED